MEMLLGLLIPALLGAAGGLGAGSILGSMRVDDAGGAEAVSNFDIGTLISGIVGGGAALGGIGGTIIKNMMAKS